MQNPSKKYICLKKLLGVLRGGVGWGLGTWFAGQGDSEGGGTGGIKEKPIPQIFETKQALPKLCFSRPSRTVVQCQIEITKV